MEQNSPKKWLGNTKKGSKALFHISLRPEALSQYTKNNNELAMPCIPSTRSARKSKDKTFGKLAGSEPEATTGPYTKHLGIKLQKRLVSNYLIRTEGISKPRRRRPNSASPGTTESTTNDPREIFKLAREKSRLSLLSTNSEASLERHPSFLTPVSNQISESKLRQPQSSRSCNKPSRLSSSSRKRMKSSRRLTASPAHSKGSRSRLTRERTTRSMGNVLAPGTSAKLSVPHQDSVLEPPVCLTRELLAASGIVASLTTAQKIEMHRERQLQSKEWLDFVKQKRTIEANSSVEAQALKQVSPEENDRASLVDSTHIVDQFTNEHQPTRDEMVSTTQEWVTVRNEFGIHPFDLLHQNSDLGQVFSQISVALLPNWFDLSLLAPVVRQSDDDFTHHNEVDDVQKYQSNVTVPVSKETYNDHESDVVYTNVANMDQQDVERDCNNSISVDNSKTSSECDQTNSNLVNSQEVHVLVSHKIGRRGSQQQLRVMKDWLELTDAIDMPLPAMAPRSNFQLWTNNTMTFAQFYKFLHPESDIQAQSLCLEIPDTHKKTSSLRANSGDSSIRIDLCRKLPTNSACLDVFLPLVQGRHVTPLHCRQLDMSCNCLGPAAFDWIVSISQQPNPRLLSNITDLDLSHNKLLNRGTKIICGSIPSACPALTRLNLASNEIGPAGGAYIGGLLAADTNILEVCLKWNCLGPTGVLGVFTPLVEENRMLQYLDVGFNAIGHNSVRERFTPFEALRCIGTAIETNRFLKHLDLSFNQLDVEMCRLLASFTLMNRTLFGLHMDGNACAQTHDGYILVDEQTCINNRAYEKVHNCYTSSHGLPDHNWINSNGFGHPKPSVHEEFVATNNGKTKSRCWVCDAYQEVEFKYRPNLSGPMPADVTEDLESQEGKGDEADSVFNGLRTETAKRSVDLHLQELDWEPIPMVRRVDVDGEYWITSVALPPMEHHYFFAVSCAQQQGQDVPQGLASSKTSSYPKLAVVARDQDRVEVNDTFSFCNPSYSHRPTVAGHYLNQVIVCPREGEIDFQFTRPRIPKGEPTMPKKAPRVVARVSTSCTPAELMEHEQCDFPVSDDKLTQPSTEFGISPKSMEDCALLKDWKLANEFSPGFRVTLQALDEQERQQIFLLYRRYYPTLLNLYRYYCCWQWDSEGIIHPALDHRNQSNSVKVTTSRRQRAKKAGKKQRNAQHVNKQFIPNPDDVFGMRCHQFVQFVYRLLHATDEADAVHKFREHYKVVCSVFWELLQSTGVPPGESQGQGNIVRIVCHRHEFTILAMIRLASLLHPNLDTQQGVKKLLDKLLAPRFVKVTALSPKTFLQGRYYSKLTENCLGAMNKTLVALFDYCQNSLSPPSSHFPTSTGINIHQWLNLFKSAGLLLPQTEVSDSSVVGNKLDYPHVPGCTRTHLFTNTDCAFAFAMSSKIEADRPYSVLSFDAFCEAIARVSDMIFIPDTNTVKALGVNGPWAVHMFSKRTGLVSYLRESNSVSASADAKYLGLATCTSSKVHLGVRLDTLIRMLVTGVSENTTRDVLEDRYWKTGVNWIGSLLSHTGTSIQHVRNVLQLVSQSSTDRTCINKAVSPETTGSTKPHSSTLKVETQTLQSFEKVVAVQLRERLGNNALLSEYMTTRLSSSQEWSTSAVTCQEQKSWCFNFSHAQGTKGWYRELAPFLVVAHIACEGVREAWMKYEVQYIRSGLISETAVGPTVPTQLNCVEIEPLINMLCADEQLEVTAEKLHIGWISRNQFAHHQDSRLLVAFHRLPQGSQERYKDIARIATLVYIEHVMLH